MADDNSNSQAGDQAEKDLASANQQIQELTETAKRAMADLQNYRKQVEKERKDFAAFANVILLMELLPILDSFNRAFNQVPDDIKTTEWFKGALQIEQQLAAIMRKQGITEMEPQVGQKLDTRMHEPITVGPGEKDIVIEEFEKGYLLGEKVIRPAKVKVGSGEPQPQV
ncbi:nucleotide exchange factor GrpE [Candidatus Peregrinibacteria bacterium]|nr:nucleotide exchange factor GrpE [Candidatus Peregrinibacteria bacterium]